MAVPRYQELTELLLTGIVDGTFGVGDKLPTEEQLCAAHGLARGSVRHAIAQLEQLGMVQRRAGAGTTVIAARPLDGYQPVAQSARDIATFATGTRLLNPDIREISLDTPTARRLGAKRGSSWFMAQGVRVRRGRDQTPLCWSEQYLRGDLPRERFLQVKFGVDEIDALEIEQTISAETLDELRARCLGVEPGSAALVITRRHRDARGRLANVGIHTHPSDRYTITTTYSKNSAG